MMIIIDRETRTSQKEKSADGNSHVVYGNASVNKNPAPFPLFLLGKNDPIIYVK